jgi:hypothetical protein
MEIPMNPVYDRIKEVSIKAQEAFWEVVVKEYKDIPDNGIGISTELEFQCASDTAVSRWFLNNVRSCRGD